MQIGALLRIYSRLLLLLALLHGADGRRQREAREPALSLRQADAPGPPAFQAHGNPVAFGFRGADASSQASSWLSNANWSATFSTAWHRLSGSFWQVPGAPSRQHTVRDHVGSTGRAIVSAIGYRPAGAALRCIMVITAIALLGYTSLAAARNLDELSGEFEASMSTQVLTVVSRTFNFMPMLCMLFVGCRLHALSVSNGAHGPPDWAKFCMYLATTGMILQILVVLIAPSCAAEEGSEEAEYVMGMGTKKRRNLQFATLTGGYNDAHPVLNRIEFKDPCRSRCLIGAEVVAIVAAYVGIAGVALSVYLIPRGGMQVPAAVTCTVLMSLVYFVTYAWLFVARSMADSPTQHALLHSALATSAVVRKAPMISALFLAIRLHAVNHNSPREIPPQWMQNLFVFVTVAFYIEVVSASVAGAIGRQHKAYYGAYVYAYDSLALKLCHHASALLVYGGLIAVMFGIRFMENMQDDFSDISTTMWCVLQYAVAYFGVMLGQTCVSIYHAAWGREHDLLRNTFVAAGVSLSIAPLLSILFVACRLRALNVTDGTGSPPVWTQECMVICVFATCIQSLCCLLMPLFVGSTCKVDDDGNPDYDLRPVVCAYAVSVVKYVALISIHSCVFAICCAMIWMSPEMTSRDIRILHDPDVRRVLADFLFWILFVFFVALLLSSAKVIGVAVKLAIESVDRLAIGVDITIENAALSICKGYVKINHLVVEQPEGQQWVQDYLLKVKMVLVKVNLWRLLTTSGKEFEIENVSLIGLRVNVEKPNAHFHEANTNVDYILDFVHGGSPKAADAAPSSKASCASVVEASPTKQEHDPDVNKTLVFVHKIALGDIGASVHIQQVPILGEVCFHPEVSTILVFEDVQQEIFHGDEGQPPDKAIASILKAVVKRTLEAAVSQAPRYLVANASRKVTLPNSIGHCLAIVHHGMGECAGNCQHKRASATGPPPPPALVKGPPRRRGVDMRVRFS